MSLEPPRAVVHPPVDRDQHALGWSLGELPRSPRLNLWIHAHRRRCPGDTARTIRLLNSTKRKMVKRRLRGSRVSSFTIFRSGTGEWTAWSLTSSEGNTDRFLFSVGCQKTTSTSYRPRSWVHVAKRVTVAKLANFYPAGSHFFALSRFSNLASRQQGLRRSLRAARRPSRRDRRTPTHRFRVDRPRCRVLRVSTRRFTAPSRRERPRE